MMRQVWLAFWSTRVGLFLWGWWWCATYPWSNPPWRPFPQWPWLDGWLRYDSGWLMSITTEGYKFVPDVQTNAAFLPLYPALSWFLGQPWRGFFNDPNAATSVTGLGLSYLGLALGLVGMHRLMRLRSTRPAADRAVWALSLFPYSFYFGAFYSEGIYLALVVWAFLRLEQRRELAACALVSLAMVCRIQGLFMGLGLALEILRRRRPALPLLVLPATGLGLMAFFYLEVGNPLAVVRAQQVWRQSSVWASLEWFTKTNLPQQLLWLGSLLCVVLVVIGGAACARRWGAGYGLAVLLSVLVPASSSLDSLGRYTSVLFPLFMLAGERLPGWVAWLQVPALLYFSYLFFTWGPAY